MVVAREWKEAEFTVFFREGLNPSGRQVGDVMPWKSYSLALSGDEISNIYRCLSSLQRVEKSTR